MKISGLSTDRKILLFLLGAAILAGIYFASRWAMDQYAFLKSMEKEIEDLRTQVQEYEENETKILSEGEENTKTAQKKSRSIDEKLKQDEDIIDNRDISDDELDEFLSRYENRKN